MSRWQRLRGFLKLNSVWFMDSWNGLRSIGLAIEIKHFCFFHHASVIPSLSGGTFAPWRNWSLGPQSRQLENEMRRKDSTSCKVLFWNVKSRLFVFKVDSIAGHVELYMWLVDPCSTWQYILTTDNLGKNGLVWKQINLGPSEETCVRCSRWAVFFELPGQWI